MTVEGWVMTDKVGSKCTFEVEIDDEDLEGLNESQRNALIDERVHEDMGNYLEWGWREEAPRG
jgi:hypothetical protein